jgi:hypothetical protein
MIILKIYVFHSLTAYFTICGNCPVSEYPTLVFSI